MWPVIVAAGYLLYELLKDEKEGNGNEHVRKNNAGDSGLGSGDQPGSPRQSVHGRRVSDGKPQNDSNDGVGSGVDPDSSKQVRAAKKHSESEHVKTEKEKAEKEKAKKLKEEIKNAEKEKNENKAAQGETT